MPRPTKGPRLYLRRARPSIGRKAVWLIRDGQRDFATGSLGSPADKGPPEAAQRALAHYIADKYRPTRKARDIEQIDISDVLSIYLDDRGGDQADQKKFEGRMSRLNSFWGGRMLSDVSTATCKEYVSVRGNTGGARRDLEDLRAAIGHHASENLHRAIVNVWLPPKGPHRDRWLTRSEAAHLLWACWRHREVQTRHRGADKGRKLPTDKRPLRHLARFILIGIYTGTRAGAIATASPQRAMGRSFVDLDQGIFYRLAQGKRATNKRQPPAPIPPRLLAHMRRWQRLGLAGSHFVEFNCKPIGSVKTAFSRAVQLAGLSSEGSKVTPHTLRHTAATWLVQRGVPLWQAAGYLGMSTEILDRVYGHHSPDHLKGAAAAITGKNKPTVSVVVSVVAEVKARAKINKRQ
jgi:integrase